MNKNIFKSAIVLTMICIICGLLVGATNYFTEPIIEENKMKEARKAYEGFFPGLDAIETTEVEGEYVYEYVKIVDKNKEVMGHAFRAKGTNARGEIDIVIAAEADGSIKGIQILSTANTPGYYDKYIGANNYLIGVNGNTVNDLTGINNIGGATQTGTTLNAMIKEAGELAHLYVTVTVVLDEYETLFGKGSEAVIDEDFIGNEIVREKALVYDEAENLLGYTYTGTVTSDVHDQYGKDKELKVMVGVDLEGKVVGLVHITNEHTPDFYSNYNEALNALNGVLVEDLKVDVVTGSTRSANVLNQIFNAIKEVIEVE